MAVMPKIPGNAAQPAGAENSSASGEGVDFSSLLKAQIKGVAVVDEAVVDTEIKARLDAVSTEFAPVDVGGQQVTDFLPGSELAPNGGLIPFAGVFLPVPADVGKQLASPGKALEGVNGDPDVLAQFSTEPPEVKAAALDSGRLAEFAVDGEILPHGRVEGGGEVLRQALLPVDTPRMPDVTASNLSAMMTANQLAMAETKPSQFSPLTLQAPVGSPGWGDALGQKVVWMAGQQTQVAELHLNPPNLGPMEVRLTVSNDQISAMFVSHQPAVRDAIEAAMPRLREMFADSGLTLGNTTVGSDSLPQQQMPGREGRSDASRQPDFAVTGNMHSPQNIGGVISLRQDGSGMVDLFA
jgi:flagellar hook-length control protein FliK